MGVTRALGLALAILHAAHGSEVVSRSNPVTSNSETGPLSTEDICIGDSALALAHEEVEQISPARSEGGALAEVAANVSAWDELRAFLREKNGMPLAEMQLEEQENAIVEVGRSIDPELRARFRIAIKANPIRAVGTLQLAVQREFLESFGISNPELIHKIYKKLPLTLQYLIASRAVTRLRAELGLHKARGSIRQKSETGEVDSNEVDQFFSFWDGLGPDQLREFKVFLSEYVATRPDEFVPAVLKQQTWWYRATLRYRDVGARVLLGLFSSKRVPPGDLAMDKDSGLSEKQFKELMQLESQQLTLMATANLETFSYRQLVLVQDRLTRLPSDGGLWVAVSKRYQAMRTIRENMEAMPAAEHDDAALARRRRIARALEGQAEVSGKEELLQRAEAALAAMKRASTPEEFEKQWILAVRYGTGAEFYRTHGPTSTFSAEPVVPFLESITRLALRQARETARGDTRRAQELLDAVVSGLCAHGIPKKLVVNDRVSDIISHFTFQGRELIETEAKELGLGPTFLQRRSLWLNLRTKERFRPTEVLETGIARHLREQNLQMEAQLREPVDLEQVLSLQPGGAKAKGKGVHTRQGVIRRPFVTSVPRNDLVYKEKAAIQSDELLAFLEKADLEDGVSFLRENVDQLTYSQLVWLRVLFLGSQPRLRPGMAYLVDQAYLDRCEELYRGFPTLGSRLKSALEAYTAGKELEQHTTATPVENILAQAVRRELLKLGGPVSDMKAAETEVAVQINHLIDRAVKIAEQRASWSPRSAAEIFEGILIALHPDIVPSKEEGFDPDRSKGFLPLAFVDRRRTVAYRKLKASPAYSKLTEAERLRLVRYLDFPTLGEGPERWRPPF